MRGIVAGADRGAPERELGALALAVLALALLGIVGLASAASPWQASRNALGAPSVAVQVVAGAGGVVLVAAVLLLWVETPTTKRAKKKRRAPEGDELDEIDESLWSAGRTVAVVLLALAIVSVAVLPLAVRDPAPQRSKVDATSPSAAGRSAQDAPARPGPSVNLGWLLLPLGVTFAILAPVAVAIRRRRLTRGSATDAEDTAALGRAVRASIAELESERDPGAAILRAYARMEQAFGDVEVVRERDETASEFLRRTERRLPASAGAAAVLTERLEEVRFSSHPITEADRQRALASLRQVELDLAVGS